LSSAPSTKHIVVPLTPSPKAKLKKLLPLVAALIASGVVLLLVILLRTPSSPPAPAKTAPAPVAKAPPPPPPAPVDAPPRPVIPAPPPKPKEPPRDLKVDLGTGATLDLVLLPAGRFRMGSPDDEHGRESDEGPIREIVFRAPFYMGKYEVTQE